MAIGLDVEEMVGECLREAARRFVLPFADPASRPEAIEKVPGEVVTSVDLAAEAYLTAELPRIVPNIRVIGEEQASTETGILNGVETDSYWLVDALDGTANFAAGSDDYAMLVAFVQAGETIASWIYRPADDVLFAARLGEGSRRNGQFLKIDQQNKPVHELSGEVLNRFLPEELKVRLHMSLTCVAQVGSGAKCIGVDYPAVIEGRKDFVVYWRTLPWDHTPGVLLLQEAGGVALRPDRSAYRPSRTQQGLIIATNAEVADAVLTHLFNL
jgi:fructose-1,6-bisphosphatase/inositol monophosphatase family enzyme